MTEIALITGYKSSHIDISSTAIKCIPLFAKLIDDPEFPPPAYMARDQHPGWRPFLAAATAVRVITLRQGKAAVQKHLRNELTSNAFPCAAHLSGWRECHWRYTILSPVVSAPEGAVELEPGLEVGPISYKVGGRHRERSFRLIVSVAIGASSRMGESCTSAGQVE
jgi:hypothetical protein